MYEILNSAELFFVVVVSHICVLNNNSQQFCKRNYWATSSNIRLFIRWCVFSFLDSVYIAPRNGRNSHIISLLMKWFGWNVFFFHFFFVCVYLRRCFGSSFSHMDQMSACWNWNLWNWIPIVTPKTWILDINKNVFYLFLELCSLLVEGKRVGARILNYSSYFMWSSSSSAENKQDCRTDRQFKVILIRQFWAIFFSTSYSIPFFSVSLPLNYFYECSMANIELIARFIWILCDTSNILMLGNYVFFLSKKCHRCHMWIQVNSLNYEFSWQYFRIMLIIRCLCESSWECYTV